MFWNDGKMVKSHRIAWQLTHGEIPIGLVVRHKCRGKCVNPNHLELGTIQENHADMVRDDTILRGERNHHNIITNEQARALKQRLNAGDRPCDLANEFEISVHALYNMKYGKSWNWISA